MNHRDFAYWLHGFTEITGGQMPTQAEWNMIVQHLELTFKKVTPPLDKDLEKAQAASPAKSPAKPEVKDNAKVQAEQQQWVEDFFKKHEKPTSPPGIGPNMTPTPYFPPGYVPYPDNAIPLPYQPQFPQWGAGDLIVKC